MRTPLVIAALLVTALPAAADAVTLFEDPAGDVGPWPTLVVGAGLPGPAEVDLVGATLDGATLRLSVARLADPAPADRLWAAGWGLDDGRYVAFGYMTTGGKAASGACVWEGMGDGGPEGDPECSDVDATLGPGSPGTLAFAVPDAYLAGGRSSPGGFVLVTPEGVAAPLEALHFTGLTVVDFAWGEDVPAPAPEAPLEAASVDAAETRAVPGSGAVALLGAVLAAAVAMTVRRRT